MDCDIELHAAGQVSDEDIEDISQQVSQAVQEAHAEGEDQLAAVFATFPKFNDTCQGDSGGPLFIKGMCLCLFSDADTMRNAICYKHASALFMYAQ